MYGMNKQQKEQAVLGLPDEYINILKKLINTIDLLHA